ncbi:MAG: succinate dehydrogenase/fumarate reductase iron-sulfur subunit [Geminicoccaceae bacterium]|nr:succinate dehydrogenase/fumarate reductase iron-sulfur subunit [Geminicoccaceae bacterium]
MLDVRIWRGKDKGGFASYNVPRRDNQTVLDIVTWVQRNLEPSLAYRFACRVGVCGSCAMTVNGRPRWTCRSHVKDVIAGRTLTVEPLRNLPRIKDLVTDLAPFFGKWQEAGGRFAPTATRNAPLTRISPQDSRRKAVDAGIECINCAVCYSACDVVSWREDYLGPAALNRAWTLVNDERHGERKETLSKVATGGGCHSCHSHGSCVEHCPVGINPTRGIAGLKRMSLLRLVGSDP